MTKFSSVLSWLASIACGVCLVLAVLATPGIARADMSCSCCGDPPYGGDPQAIQAYQDCQNYCFSHGGNCAAAISCGPSAYSLTSPTNCSGLCFLGGCGPSSHNNQGAGRADYIPNAGSVVVYNCEC